MENTEQYLRAAADVCTQHRNVTGLLQVLVSVYKNQPTNKKSHKLCKKRYL